MMSYPLVSIGVLVYRNYCHLYETLDAVLMQDYPNIELYVSDDGSDEFPKEEVEEYILTHRTTNIKVFTVHQNEQNMGTVKHLNRVIQQTTGEALLLMAGDDALASENIISRFVKSAFEEYHSETVYMAQVAMCNSALSQVEYYFVTDAVKKAFQQANQKELYRLICTRPCFPSVATFFKREFFEKFGYFDEQYFLIEDWPTHIRMMRNGVPIRYIDFVAVKHRHGGISHGNMVGTTSTSQKYSADILKIRLEEILPYCSEFDAKAQHFIKSAAREERMHHEPAIKKLRGLSKLGYLWFHFPFRMLMDVCLKCFHGLRSRKAIGLLILFGGLAVMSPYICGGIASSLNLILGFPLEATIGALTFVLRGLSICGIALFALFSLLFVTGAIIAFAITPQGYYY